MEFQIKIYERQNLSPKPFFLRLKSVIMLMIEEGIKMTNEDILNQRLKIEFQNLIYDVLDEVIIYTMEQATL